MRSRQWLRDLLDSGEAVGVPEMADYEVRRELLRADKKHGLQRLDSLKSQLPYVPIMTEAMLKAAEFWAQARKQGKPTAGDKALDCDVILAGQAAVLTAEYDEVIIATTNVAHMSRFVETRNWQDIQPAPQGGDQP